MKNHTHQDAHSFFVHHSGNLHNAQAYIKWEGYLTKDEDLFQIHYFDCIWRYTEWLEEQDIFHMGNTEYIPLEEYTSAYHAMMEECI